MNKDSLYLLEALAQGRCVEPYFVVDVHAPSVQGLFYSLGLQEKKVVATSSTFKGSAVLDAMKGKYASTYSTCFYIFNIKWGDYSSYHYSHILTSSLN